MSADRPRAMSVQWETKNRCIPHRGTTHALIDRAENLSPDAVMAQSIREIEQVIAEVRIDLGKAEVTKHLVMSQMAKLNGEHEKPAEQVDPAVSQDRDDLASSEVICRRHLEMFEMRTTQPGTASSNSYFGLRTRWWLPGKFMGCRYTRATLIPAPSGVY